MSNNLKKGEIYNSFEVLNVFDIIDYHSTAIHLRHLKTGLEVFHMLNDDFENLFAFTFRTPNETSNGLAHIIEHSVLCGSEKYPLKDPFVVLSNQSVKTYLNAMTYSDKTVYPASSISKTDYFNLMSVYGDAVFFPQLKKEIFMQEAHRLELDENGKPSIQGVVYNEMKGNYSSFESVASDIAIRSLLKNSIYEKDSGGDPLEIPDVTYEDFCNFHKKWYRPDNCFVFLYGNIPTEEQLDFLQKNFLTRLEQKFSNIDSSKKNRDKILENFLKFVIPPSVNEPVVLYEEGPSGDGEEKNTVLVNWCIGRAQNALAATEKTILAGILCNHDGSPLQKALLDSGLGEDLAPQSGLFSSIYTSIFTVGLRGVKKGNEKKVEDLILETIKNLVENGIPERDIESTLMSLEFSHREIKRGHGPFSLSLMARPIYGWLYGDGVENQLRLRSHLEEIRKKIETDKNYLKNLFKTLLLDNKSRSLVVVTPSKSYTQKRVEAENKKITAILKKKSLEEIKSENDALHLFQQEEDDVSLLPHLLPKDFITDGKPLMNRLDTKIDFINGVSDSKIPFIKNYENTNGILYFDIGFPADVLKPSDYPLLPFFADCVTECGWKNLNWAQTSELCALYTGGLGVNLLTMEGPKTEKAGELAKKYNWINRDWVIFRISMLEENISKAIDILEDCLLETDFSDKKRISDILVESKNDFESSIIPEGHVFVSNRALCRNSRKTAIDEIWNGISQFYTLKNLVDYSTDKIIDEFNRIFKELKSGGAFIHVTAEESGFKKLNDKLLNFVGKTKLKAPLNPAEATDEDFFALTEINDSAKNLPSKSTDEVFTVSAQVGYASQCINASSYDDKNSYSEEICTHWLSNNLLWEKIRTIGGAYGAFCNLEPMSGAMLFATYRDPVPLNSCDTFEECLNEAGKIEFSEDEVICAIMGCYSHFIQPQSPKGRGATALTRLLYGITDFDREQKILGILNTTKEEFHNAFLRLSKITFRKKVVICNKKLISDKGFAGKIINLPL